MILALLNPELSYHVHIYIA